jgi:hypothetical protein
MAGWVVAQQPLADSGVERRAQGRADVSYERSVVGRILVRVLSSRINTPMIVTVNQEIPAHRMCDKFWHGTGGPTVSIGIP